MGHWYCPPSLCDTTCITWHISYIFPLHYVFLGGNLNNTAKNPKVDHLQDCIYHKAKIVPLDMSSHAPSKVMENAKTLFVK